MPKKNRVLGRVRDGASEDTKEAIAIMTNNDIRENISNFNYDSLINIDEKSKNKLMLAEKELIFQGQQLNKMAFEVGRTLHNARDIFIKSHSESFMEWYESFGLDKDKVSIFMSRYKISLEHPESSERIIALSDSVIKETVNKKNPTNILERVLNGELKTAQQIKNERKNNSGTPELLINKDEIEECEIIVPFVQFEPVLDKIDKELSRIQNKLIKENGANEDVLGRLKEMLNNLRRIN